MKFNEQNFQDLAEAAWLAQDAGKQELAERLDVLARKANLDCTRSTVDRAFPMSKSFPGSRSLKWQDMPSVLKLPTDDNED